MAAVPGKVVIVSGPSGVGKSTIVARLVDKFAGHLRVSVSATTRSPRPGEVSNKHYHFLTDEEFARRREAGEFLECVEVFGRGHWYGTLHSEVRPSLAAGVWVLLEIDVDGAQEARRQYPEAISVFIAPRSEQELEQRLRDRRTDSEAAIQRRLEVARHELAQADSYDHVVVNDTVDEAVSQITGILQKLGLTA